MDLATVEGAAVEAMMEATVKVGVKGQQQGESQGSSSCGRVQQTGRGRHGLGSNQGSSGVRQKARQKLMKRKRTDMMKARVDGSTTRRQSR